MMQRAQRQTNMQFFRYGALGVLSRVGIGLKAS